MQRLSIPVPVILLSFNTITTNELIKRGGTDHVNDLYPIFYTGKYPVLVCFIEEYILECEFNLIDVCHFFE